MKPTLFIFVSLSFVASADRRPNGSPYDTLPVFFQQLLRKEMPLYELRFKLDRIMKHAERELQIFRELSAEQRGPLRNIEIITVDFEESADIRLQQVNELIKEANITGDDENLFHERSEYEMSEKSFFAEDTPLLAKEFYTRIVNAFLSEECLNESQDKRVRMLWGAVYQYEQEIKMNPKFYDEMLKVQDHISGKKKFAPISV